ncbi:MAG: nucleotidyltransferase family protein [Bacteroidales bacterium]|nr:nucleotidyltransferase family protein [Bacteroidales bacterium]
MAGLSPDRALTLLFPLLRLSLWGTPLPDAVKQETRLLNESDWEVLISVAKNQSVTGLLFQAVDSLPEDIEIPDKTLVQLAVMADRIEASYRRISTASEIVLTELRNEGLNPVVMKGLSCASWYPRPELRQSGDIDIYLPKLPTKSGRHFQTSPDGSLHFQQDGVDIDIHSRYFDIHHHTEYLPSVPSPEAEWMMISLHILKHATTSGVGLRQICDAALLWKILPDNSKASLPIIFKATHTMRWHLLLFSFLEDYFHIQNPLRHISSKPLLSIIAHGGNFGHHSTSRSRLLKAPSFIRKADTAFRFLLRIPFSLRFAPREILPTIKELTTGNLQHAFTADSHSILH